MSIQHTNQIALHAFDNKIIEPVHCEDLRDYVRKSFENTSKYFTAYMNYMGQSVRNASHYIEVPFNADAIHDIEFYILTDQNIENNITIEFVSHDDSIVDKLNYNLNDNCFRTNWSSWKYPFPIYSMPRFNSNYVRNNGRFQFKITITQPGNYIINYRWRCSFYSNWYRNNLSSFPGNLQIDNTIIGCKRSYEDNT